MQQCVSKNTHLVLSMLKVSLLSWISYSLLSSTVWKIKLIKITGL